MNRNVIYTACFLLFCIWGCKEQGKSNSRAHAGDDTAGTVTLQRVRSLLEQQHISPFYLFAADSISKQYICLYEAGAAGTATENPYFFSDTAVRVIAARVQLTGNGELKVMKQQSVLSADWTYCTIDSAINRVTIAGKPFIGLSYETSFMGTAVTERYIGFVLIAEGDLQQQILQFEGRASSKCDDCLEGQLLNEADFQKQPEVMAYFRKQVAAHPRIYHPSEADNDIYNVINYEKKWEEDNHTSNHTANGHGDVPLPLKTTYYRADLFALQKGSDFDAAENEQYRFKSYFCGSVIGFDKSKQLWFPVVIEDCNGMCSKNISLAAGRLIVRYDDDNIYEVPLSGIIFDERNIK